MSDKKDPFSNIPFQIGSRDILDLIATFSPYLLDPTADPTEIDVVKMANSLQLLPPELIIKMMEVVEEKRLIGQEIRIYAKAGQKAQRNRSLQQDKTPSGGTGNHSGRPGPNVVAFRDRKRN